MPDSTSSHGGSSTAASSSTPQVDVTLIEDPNVRRAVRAVVQLSQGMELRIRQQQQEIEALLQMMTEKHVGSVGEFKRHLLRLQQGDARGERIHGQIAAAATGAGTAPAAVAAPTSVNKDKPVRPAPVEPRYSEPEIDRPRRYTL
jgi:TolA-binding protein